MLRIVKKRCSDKIIDIDSTVIFRARKVSLCVCVCVCGSWRAKVTEGAQQGGRLDSDHPPTHGKVNACLRVHC